MSRCPVIEKYSYIIEEVRVICLRPYIQFDQGHAVIPSVVMATFDYVSASLERRLLASILATPLRGCIYVEICGKVSLSPSSSSSNEEDDVEPVEENGSLRERLNIVWQSTVKLACMNCLFRAIVGLQRKVFSKGGFSLWKIKWTRLKRNFIEGEVSFGSDIEPLFSGMIWLVKCSTN